LNQETTEATEVTEESKGSKDKEQLPPFAAFASSPENKPKPVTWIFMPQGEAPS
jgi:hypothetical protein